MWIFTTKGFFSIVKYEGDTSHFVVRSRVRGDIEETWPDARVLTWPDKDYLYRARIPRWDVIEAMEEALEAIDYTNYKAAANVEDPRRSVYLGMIWAIMSDMQEALAGRAVEPPFLPRKHTGKCTKSGMSDAVEIEICL
jgi:hypothetical protein